jgi:[ribosomal protein S18]-alanine N-acetyltransferase
MSWSQPTSKLGAYPCEFWFQAAGDTAPERLILRPVIAADLIRIAALEAEAYPFPWTLKNFADSIESGYDFWALEGSSEILAYALVMWLPDEAHLLNITVRPQRQAKGLGRQFLSWLLKDAQLRGALSMLLEVRPTNPRAMALYGSMGFSQIARRKGYYPSWNNSREDALVLSKPLLV